LVTIKGTVPGSTGPVSDTANPILIKMIDICDPPTSLTASDLTDQVVTITDANHPDYTPANFVTIVPADCPYTYTWATTDLSNELGSAISRVGDTFSFFYGDELDEQTES